MRKFGEVVKSRRRFLKLTLEDVARKVGTHKGYLSGIENGKVKPPAPGITEKLCQALEIGVEGMLLRGWAEKAPKRIRPWVADLASKELHER